VSDIKAQLKNEGGAVEFDLVIEKNDVAVDDGLETAVLVSLFTDRRAEETDQLPDGETSRRGSWIDAFPVVPNDHFGSRLWLLGREKQQQSVLDRARAYALEALQWLIEDKIAQKVEVTAEIVSPGVLGLRVEISRPLGDVVKFRTNYAWLAQAGS
jgi:phage gp46-like protein